MKKEHMTNLWMQALLMAAVVGTAAMIPADAMAQLSQTVDKSATSVFNPVIKVINYGAYAVGTVLGISGVIGFKNHADNPANNKISTAIGKTGAGAVLLAFPSVVKVLSGTGNDTLSGSGAFQSITGVQ